MKRLIQVIVLMVLIGATIDLTLGNVAMAAPAVTDCKAFNNKTTFVICVDVSAQRGSVRSASSGVIGEKVIDTFVVTTSRVDTDGPNANGDTITKQGQFVGYNPQAKTESGLKNYIQFGPGRQGVHAFSKVGEGYDSHGCVRVTSKTAMNIWDLLVAGPNGNLVKAGKVEIHIYP